MFVLDTNVSKLLKKYKLKLEFAPLHCPGLIVHGKNGKPDVIVVNSKLNDDQVENVILHEIGHAKNDGDVLGDTKQMIVPAHVASMELMFFGFTKKSNSTLR